MIDNREWENHNWINIPSKHFEKCILPPTYIDTHPHKHTRARACAHKHTHTHWYKVTYVHSLMVKKPLFYEYIFLNSLLPYECT